MPDEAHARPWPYRARFWLIAAITAHWSNALAARRLASSHSMLLSARGAKPVDEVLKNLPWIAPVVAALLVGYLTIRTLRKNERTKVFNDSAKTYRDFLQPIIQQLTPLSQHELLPATHQVLLSSRSDIVLESDRFKAVILTRHERDAFDAAVADLLNLIEDSHGWREEGVLARFSAAGPTIGASRAYEASAQTEARGYLQALLDHAKPK